jgi:Leucine-rich repeat (LRR) protein
MGGNSISSIVSLQLSFASKLKNLSLRNNKIIRASTQIQIEKSDDSFLTFEMSDVLQSRPWGAWRKGG